MDLITPPEQTNSPTSERILQAIELFELGRDDDDLVIGFLLVTFASIEGGYARILARRVAEGVGEIKKEMGMVDDG